MKNYLQDDCKIVVTAPYAVAAGAGCLVGSVFGVAESAIASGARGVLVLEGVLTLAKATGAAWTEGARIYWDDSAKNCTTTASTNKLIGVAVLHPTALTVPASGDTTGTVLLTKAFTL